jgi:hypothetical protein
MTVALDAGCRTAQRIHACVPSPVASAGPKGKNVLQHGYGCLWVVTSALTPSMFSTPAAGGLGSSSTEQALDLPTSSEIE